MTNPHSRTAAVVGTAIGRRTFVRAALLGAGAVTIGRSLLAFGTAQAAAHHVIATRYGPLGPPDSEGLRLPPVFTGRCVARTGVPPVPGAPAWHAAPDGAVSALDFDAQG